MTNRNIQILQGTFETNEGKSNDGIDYESIFEDTEAFWAELRAKPSIKDCESKGYIVLTDSDLEKYNLKFLKYESEGFVVVVCEKCYYKPIKTQDGKYYAIVPQDPSEFFWRNFERRILSENMDDKDFFKRAETFCNHLKYIRSVERVGETPEIIDYEIKSQLETKQLNLLILNKKLKAHEKRKNKKFSPYNPIIIKRNIEKIERDIKSLEKNLYVKPEEDNSLEETSSLDDHDNFKYNIRDYFR